MKMFLVYFLILIFLRPNPSYLTNRLSVFLGDIILITVFIFYMFYLKKLKFNKNTSFIFKYLFIIFFAISIPTFYHLIRYADLALLENYFRLSYLLASFVIFISYFSYMNRTIDFIKVFNFIALIIFIVAIIQLFQIPYLNLITRLFYNQSKLRSIYTGYPRVFSTFYNSNWFAAYLILLLAWLNSFFSNKLIKIKIYFIFLIVLMILFILSGSRTGLLGFGVVLFTQFLIIKPSFKKILYFSLIITLLVSIISLFNDIEVFRSLTNRFYSFYYDLLSETSFSEYNIRWSYWEYSIEQFIITPILGNGSLSYIPHNSYFYILHQYGLLFGGIILLTSFLLLIKIFAVKIKSNFAFNTLIGMWMGFLSISFFADFFFTTQVMLAYLITTAFLLSIDKNLYLSFTKNTLGDKNG